LQKRARKALAAQAFLVDFSAAQQLRSLTLRRRFCAGRHRQGLAVGAQSHHRAVDFAVARVDDLAIVVPQSLPFHAANKRKAEDRIVPAVIGTSGADGMGILAQRIKEATAACQGETLRYGKPK
jgi:hypothetical protein